MYPVIDFATQLRLTRDLLGWRQYRMAEALGVHANTVSIWEMGAREPHASYPRMLKILAEREGLIYDEEGYPKHGRQSSELAPER